MSTTDAGVVGLVKVTVRHADKSADLALPAAVPVAELVPEVARTLGALDPTSAHHGFRFVTSEGTPLSGSAGLVFQNIHDGAVLVLTPGVEEPRRVYDDVVEAMADVVEATTSPWSPESARRTALVAATGLLGLGALTIALERPSVIAGSLAGVVALVLVTAAIVLARLEDEAEVAVVLGWSAAGFAAVGGITAVDVGALLGWPTAAAGAGAAVAAGLTMLGLTSHRLLLMPAVIVGGLVALASSVVASTDFAAPQVYLTILLVITIAAGIQPALSLASVGAGAPQPQDPSVLPDDPDEVPLEQVQRSVRTGHDVLLALTASTGLLLLLTAPLAVTRGLTGALVVVCVSLALLVRTRQFRSGAEVAVGIVSAGSGLAALALSVLVLQPQWRLGLVIALVVVAAGTLVATLVPTDSSVRRGRTAEVIELAALVAMLPLYVIAVGIVSAVMS